MNHWEHLVNCAGPTALQMGISLEKRGSDCRTCSERFNRSSSLYPQNRRLISSNKTNCYRNVSHGVLHARSTWLSVDVGLTLHDDGKGNIHRLPSTDSSLFRQFHGPNGLRWLGLLCPQRW